MDLLGNIAKSTGNFLSTAGQDIGGIINNVASGLHDTFQNDFKSFGQQPSAPGIGQNQPFDYGQMAQNLTNTLDNISQNIQQLPQNVSKDIQQMPGRVANKLSTMPLLPTSFNAVAPGWSQPLPIVLKSAAQGMTAPQDEAPPSEGVNAPGSPYSLGSFMGSPFGGGGLSQTAQEAGKTFNVARGAIGAAVGAGTNLAANVLAKQPQDLGQLAVNAGAGFLLGGVTPIEGSNNIMSKGGIKYEPEAVQEIQNQAATLAQHQQEFVSDPNGAINKMLPQKTFTSWWRAQPMNHTPEGSVALKDAHGTFGFVDPNNVVDNINTKKEAMSKDVIGQFTANNGYPQLAVVRQTYDENGNPNPLDITDGHHRFPVGKDIGLQKIPAVILDEKAPLLEDSFNQVKSMGKPMQVGITSAQDANTVVAKYLKQGSKQVSTGNIDKGFSNLQRVTDTTKGSLQSTLNDGATQVNRMETNTHGLYFGTPEPSYWLNLQSNDPVETTASLAKFAKDNNQDSFFTGTQDPNGKNLGVRMDFGKPLTNRQVLKVQKIANGEGLGLTINQKTGEAYSYHISEWDNKTPQEFIASKDNAVAALQKAGFNPNELVDKYNVNVYNKDSYDQYISRSKRFGQANTGVQPEGASTRQIVNQETNGNAGALLPKESKLPSETVKVAGRVKDVNASDAIVAQQKASQSLPVFQRILQQGADSINGITQSGVKDLRSLSQKVADDKGRSFTNNPDTLRGTILGVDKDSISKAIDQVKQNPDVSVIKEKVKTNPATGYDATHLQIRLNSTGQKAEIQFHTPDSLVTREISHAQYKSGVSTEVPTVKPSGIPFKPSTEWQEAPTDEKGTPVTTGLPSGASYRIDGNKVYVKWSRLPKQMGVMSNQIASGKTISKNFDAALGTELKGKNGLPPQDTKNQVTFSIRGVSDKDRVKSAIGNSVAVRNALNIRGKDAFTSGGKLSPEDLKLAEQYEHGQSIDNLSQQAQNPTAFKTFMNKLSDYYDFRLATDRALGGQTQLRQNYLPHIWDLTKPEDLEKFNQFATQKGLLPWDGYRAQPRVFDTYAEGEAEGFTRKNPNILSDLQSDYKGSSSTLSRVALKTGLQTAVPGKISNIGAGKTPDGESFINTNIKGLEGLSLHPDVNKMLQGFQPTAGKDLFTEIKNKGFTEGLKSTGVGDTVASLYDHASMPMKEMLLNLSGFHSLNISANYGGTMLLKNPYIGVRGLAQSVPSFFSERVTQGIIDGFKQKMIPGKNYSVFDAGIRAGVNLDRALPQEGLDKLNPFHALKTAIFDRELHTMKINLVDAVFGNGKLDPESSQGRQAGLEINRIMGEVNNETMNMNPNTMKWLNRALLAPSFTTSKYATLSDAATQGGSAGTLARQAVFGKTILLGTLSTLGTLLATGKFPTLGQVLTNYTVSPSVQTNLTNPKGYKQDIEMPQTFASEPLKPLVQGFQQQSWNPLIHYGEARLNPIPGLALRAGANQDFYGTPIVSPMSKDSVPMQLGKNLGIGMLPIGLQNVVNTMRGKITPEQAAINIAGLRTVTSKDEPVMQYFTGLTKAGNSIQNPDDRNLFTNVLHPTTKDANGNVLVDKTTNYTPEKYNVFMDHPDILPVEQKFQQSQANHAPIWDRSADDVKAYMAYSLSADPGVKAQIRLQNPWLPKAQLAQVQYGQTISMQNGEIPAIQPPDPMQLLDDKQVQVVSAYTASSKGSVQRKELLSQNPWLVDYWNANSAYYKQYPITPGQDANGNSIPQTGLNKWLQSNGITTTTSASGGGFSGGGGSGLGMVGQLPAGYLERAQLRMMLSQMMTANQLPQVMLNAGGKNQQLRQSFKPIDINNLSMNIPQLAKLGQMSPRIKEPNFQRIQFQPLNEPVSMKGLGLAAVR